MMDGPLRLSSSSPLDPSGRAHFRRAIKERQRRRLEASLQMLGDEAIARASINTSNGEERLPALWKRPSLVEHGPLPPQTGDDAGGHGEETTTDEGPEDGTRNQQQRQQKSGMASPEKAPRQTLPLAPSTEIIRPTNTQRNLARNPNPIPADKVYRASRFGPNYIPEEETLRNDYSQNYVDTGRRPQNFIQNPYAETRFAEYPKLSRLVTLKDQQVSQTACPPTYQRANLRPFPSRGAFNLSTLLPIKYDVVLIDPPLQMYARESVGCALASSHSSSEGADKKTTEATDGAELRKPWSWKEIAALPVPLISAKESFVFLWVGNGSDDGLEKGREILARWGYRRCEDIVWCQTNERRVAHGSERPTTSLLTHTKQHCLMGIRGTVRRATDFNFVHCNIDTDVIVWEGVDGDPTAKPPELYNLIENFCLGTRRLELFGSNRCLRRGWLTIGLDVGPTAALDAAAAGPSDPRTAAEVREQLRLLEGAREYRKEEYDACFGIDPPGCELKDRKNLVPLTAEIDALRPKSPPARGADHVSPSSATVTRLTGVGAGGDIVAARPSTSPTQTQSQVESRISGEHAAMAQRVALERRLAKTALARAAAAANAAAVGAGAAAAAPGHASMPLPSQFPTAGMGMSEKQQPQDMVSPVPPLGVSVPGVPIGWPGGGSGAMGSMIQGGQGAIPPLPSAPNARFFPSSRSGPP